MFEDTREPVRVNVCQTDPVLDPAVVEIGKTLQQFGSVVDEPAQAFGETAEFAQARPSADRNRREGHHTADRIRLDWEAPFIREPEDIEVIAVLLAPQAALPVPDMIDHRADIHEVLEELGRDVLINRILLGEFQRDTQQIQTVHGHPAGAVGLFELPAAGQSGGAVEGADVVEPQESTLEDVVALGVLAIDPPGEIDQQLLEYPLQEGSIGTAIHLLLDL